MISVNMKDKNICDMLNENINKYKIISLIC